MVRGFGDWQAEQPEFTSLSLYGFKPMKGAILLRIEPDFVSRLVDAFYGGSGAASPKRGKEFTATEESLLGRLAEALIGALAEIWAEIIPAKPALRARETNIGFVALAKADEPVAVSQFTIQPWAGQAAAIEILYPLAGLRSVEAALAAKMPDEVGAKGAEWKARLDAALGRGPDRGAHRARAARAAAFRTDAAAGRRRHPGQPAASRAADRRGPPDRDRRGRRA